MTATVRVLKTTGRYEYAAHGCREDSFGVTMLDGFEWIHEIEKLPGWSPVSSWGRDGWDAGDWPLVAVAKNTGPNLVDRWAFVVRVEGDIERSLFCSEACRDSAIDELVAWYWAASGDSHEAAVVASASGVYELPRGESAPLPPRFRGPFSWERLERERDEIDWRVPRRFDTPSGLPREGEAGHFVGCSCASCLGVDHE